MTVHPTGRPLPRPAAPLTHTVLAATPVGPLTLVALGDALTGLYMTDQRHRPPQETFGAPAAPDDPPFAAAIAQLHAYFRGELTTFDLPLELRGTPFQRRVWAALCTIPYGTTVSYGELAERLGAPTAARAVGLANGRNPVGIIVPCHRVVGADGSLTGYGGGLDRKRRLLAFERTGSGCFPGTEREPFPGEESALFTVADCS
ncbi:methylated-DNA--[protein]-cysteine S-methyltransferase [Streptomyces chattanoogensis]|uniref:methylated-DNA--[protein]-cysteine S-methyltransferase n=1 Tax=Streptomyces chattanoogensis TaxID=66876 RepID=UPI00099DB0B7|nr:methylated-DNA--[protein]-cysteine S-methyltransferase [Streptomyces chattanoogensis]